MQTQELLAIAAVTLAVIAAYSLARDLPDGPFEASVPQRVPLHAGLQLSHLFPGGAR